MYQRRGKMSDETRAIALEKINVFQEKVQPVIEELHKVTGENDIAFVADFCVGKFNGGLVTKGFGNAIGMVGDDFPVHYVIFTLLSRQKMTLEELAKAIVEDRLAEALVEWGGGVMFNVDEIKNIFGNPSGGDPGMN